MADDNEGAAGSGEKGSTGNPATIVVEIEGKQVTKSVEDVVNLIQGQAATTQRSQQVAPLIQFMEQYQLDAETLIGQSKGAFETIGNLIDAGLINENGEVIQKKAGDGKDGGDDFLTNFQASGEGGGSDIGKLLEGERSKTEAIVQKALEPFEGMATTIERLSKDNTRLIRLEVARRLTGDHPNLSEEDTSRIMAIASADGTKSVKQHASDYVEKKKGAAEKTREAYAKEFNVDLAEFDKANARKEQDSKGASGLAEGKKFSFSRRDRGKSQEDNLANPGDAAAEYMRSG